jgi:RNA polymerase I-specific transcription initiation factor RRN3
MLMICAYQGNDTPYLELTSHFLPTPTTPIPDLTSLISLIQAMISNINLLQASTHASLVKAIINLPWASAGDEPFVRIYTGFLGVLCSAKTEWIGEVVNMAVKGLTWRKSPLLDCFPP